MYPGLAGAFDTHHNPKISMKGQGWLKPLQVKSVGKQKGTKNMRLEITPQNNCECPSDTHKSKLD